MNSRDLLWVALLPEVPATSSWLFRRFQGLLTTDECLDACRDAIPGTVKSYLGRHGGNLLIPVSSRSPAEQVRDYLVRPDADILPLYRTVAYREAVGMLRDKGHHECPRCRGEGEIEGECCPQCFAGWLRGEVGVAPEFFQAVVGRHTVEGGLPRHTGLDPWAYFVLPAPYRASLDPRTIRVITAIDRGLTPNERIVWWVRTTATIEAVPNTVLATLLNTTEENIRQILHRARVKVRHIVDGDNDAGGAVVA